MADLPISFSAPMVRALLDGNKTQTRRALRPQPRGHVWRYGWEHDKGATWSDDAGHHKLRIWAGNRLYVREHWRTEKAYDDLSPSEMGGEEPVRYLADNLLQTWGFPTAHFEAGRHRQAMHMPRWASRLTLTVTDVRVERLQAISEADAVAEGCFKGKASGRVFANEAAMHLGGDEWANARDWYADTWEVINGSGSWDANPWVAAYTFTVHRGNIDQIGGAA